jgi:hypothetical protein
VEPAGNKSAIAFFGVVVALFLPALLAQQASPVAGLAATQVFAFLLPAVVATVGSNLRVAPYLRLRTPRPALLVLGALAGAAAYLVGGGIMSLTERFLPRSWVEAYDLARLFEGPPWERIALAAIAAVLAPACEEITFRGYVQSTLSLRRRPAVAIGGGALLFALLHLDPVRFPALLLLGIVFGWLVWRAGSVWPAVAAHATNNGLAAALLLLGRPPEPASPPPSAVLSAIAFGGVALALLLLAYGAAARGAPVQDTVTLRDASAPSILFDPARVPRALALSALAGGAVLVLLAILGAGRGFTRAP